MNYLNRIILINCANIPYREVQLNGNIHFIGTQGTGKSTMLRAILFFYNAESRKLGLSKEKKSFADYYFPFVDSYVVYEIQKGDRKFCAWLFKRQNRLVFRFIDGPYNKEAFLQDNRACTQAEIVTNYTNEGISFSPVIVNFSDFRDIIYGANTDLSRYSITVNKSYQNIPRTISNVFLNSSLNAGFIKQTIIQSLSDENFEINLEANRHHLESARQDYMDVNSYLKQESMAHSIVGSYEELITLEKNRKSTAHNAWGAYNYSLLQINLLKQECTQLGKTQLDQKNQIQQLKRTHEESQQKIKDQLAVVNSQIQKAKQKQKEYQIFKIQQILHENDQESLYQQQISQLQQQKKLLTENLSQIEEAFDNSMAQVKNEIQTRIHQIREKCAEKRNMLQQAQFQAQKMELNKEHQAQNDLQEKTSLPKKEIIKLDKEKTRLEAEIKHLSHTRFMEKENDEINSHIHNVREENLKLKAKCDNLQHAMETLLQKGENERKACEYEFGNKNQALTQNRLQLEKRLQQLDKDLKDLEGSLLEFLDLNMQGWQNNIGKTASRQLLLRGDLSPEKCQGESFFGLKIDLDAIPSTPLSKITLEKELRQTEEDYSQLLTQLNLNKQEEEDQQNRITKKYNRLIAQSKQELKEALLAKDNNEMEREKAQLQLNNLKEKAQTLKQEQQQLLAQQLLQIEEGILTEKKTIDHLQKQHHQQMEVEKILIRKKLEEITLSLKTLEEQTDEQIDALNKEGNHQLEQLQIQRNQTLQQEGIDTKKLESLDRSLAKVKKALKRIEKNKRLVYSYEKDFEEYISKLEDFQLQKQEMEGEISQTRQLHRKQMEVDKQQLQQIQQQLNQIEKKREDHEREKEMMNLFMKEKLFLEMRSIMEHQDSYSGENCTTLLNTLKNQALEFEKQDKRLNEQIVSFTGFFNEDNCLKFNVHISTPVQARAFAENLKEFVQEQKIVDFRTEVSRKYAMVMESVVNETEELLNKEKDIEKIISRINKDFKKSNFVGVVRSIEMRLQQSSNPVIQILRKIRSFQQEKLMQFGEINLFSQGDSKDNDKEAVHLLESLQRSISELKKSRLQLEDAFELEFRIRENENDTNWVNRLSNVGSNGTDVLVKSMIYINLLNIFKQNGSKTNTDTYLHCLIDEVGILHDSNVKGLINFAAERKIWLINGSPNSHNERDYNHIYIFRKNPQNNQTQITKLLSNEI